jgi:hypothetical protein
VNGNGWIKQAVSGLVLLLVIAIGARVIYELLAPLLPLLGATVVLVAVYVVLFRGWRH